MRFRGSFQGLVAQIEYSHQRKKTSKTRISSFVTISKSSFGEHEIAQSNRHTAGSGVCESLGKK